MPERTGWSTINGGNFDLAPGFGDAQVAELEELKKKNAILRELLKQAMKERHYTLPPAPQFYNSQPRSAHCGAPIGTSIDTCEYCRPYREALANA